MLLPVCVSTIPLPAIEKALPVCISWSLWFFVYTLILKTDFFFFVKDSFCITKEASLPALGICCLLQLTRQFVQCLLSSPCQKAWKI